MEQLLLIKEYFLLKFKEFSNYWESLDGKPTFSKLLFKKVDKIELNKDLLTRLVSDDKVIKELWQLDGVQSQKW